MKELKLHIPMLECMICRCRYGCHSKEGVEHCLDCKKPACTATEDISNSICHDCHPEVFWPALLATNINIRYGTVCFISIELSGCEYCRLNDCLMNQKLDLAVERKHYSRQLECFI